MVLSRPRPCLAPDVESWPSRGCFEHAERIRHFWFPRHSCGSGGVLLPGLVRGAGVVARIARPVQGCSLQSPILDPPVRTKNLLNRVPDLLECVLVVLADKLRVGLSHHARVSLLAGRANKTGPSGYMEDISVAPGEGPWRGRGTETTDPPPAGGWPAKRTSKPRLGRSKQKEGTSSDYSRSRASGRGIPRAHPRAVDHWPCAYGHRCTPVDPGRHRPSRWRPHPLLVAPAARLLVAPAARSPNQPGDSRPPRADLNN